MFLDVEIQKVEDRHGISHVGARGKRHIIQDFNILMSKICSTSAQNIASFVFSKFVPEYRYLRAPSNFSDSY